MPLYRRRKSPADAGLVAFFGILKGDKFAVIAYDGIGRFIAGVIAK